MTHQQLRKTNNPPMKFEYAYALKGSLHVRIIGIIPFCVIYKSRMYDPCRPLLNDNNS